MGYQPATYKIVKRSLGYYVVKIDSYSLGPFASLRRAEKELRELVESDKPDVLIAQYDKEGRRI